MIDDVHPNTEGESARAEDTMAFASPPGTQPIYDQVFPLLPALAAHQENERQRAAELQVLVQSMVRHLHLQNSSTAIHLPDGDGVFPTMAPWLASLVVVDANTLRNDILYACCHEAKPTTLVNGANSGMLRLFCARHVLEEIKEHHQEWCETADVDVTAFAQLFNASYAPLLRVVHQVPEGLLSAEEQDRVETLRGQDPDDIPSVTLALLLRAFYMSEDRKAVRAVYGREFSREEVRAWREVLSAGGNAGAIGNLFQAGAMLSGGLGIGIWGIFDKLTGSFSPWLKIFIAAALIGGGGYLYLQMPEERRVGFRNVIGQAFRVAGAFSAEYVEATARVNRALPAVPSREQLAGEQQPRNVLTRACVHALARAQGDQSAEELATLLPDLGVGQSAPLVREVLRKYPYCFREVYRGRWQVGTALVRAPRHVAESGD